MKNRKALLAAVCLITALYMGGCAENKTTSISSIPPVSSAATKPADANNQSATDPQSGLTLAQFMDKLQKTVSMSKVDDKNSYIVGAVDGKAFIANKITYEIFLYQDEAKINEAKSGSAVLFNTMKVDATVNGNFVLYAQPNQGEDAVIQAFKNIK